MKTEQANHIRQTVLNGTHRWGKDVKIFPSFVRVKEDNFSFEYKTEVYRRMFPAFVVTGIKPNIYISNF